MKFVRLTYDRKTLLSVMKNFNVPQPLNWTTNNWFEEVCLSIDSSSGQTCPLFHSAALRWDELSVLLMENGATPQTTCFGEFSKISQHPSGTVLSRLIGSTRNMNNEVQDLLRTAVNLNVGHIITLQDINAILSPDKPSRRRIRWSYSGLLSWNLGSEWHRDYEMQLWQSIAMANISQVQKISDPQSRSTVIIEAAQQRRFWAVKVLLDMGLDPNARASRWRFWRLNVTAIDVVAWTSSVGAVKCDESGLRLKERDAEIVDLLQSRGGTRGIEYRIEYQLVLAFVQTLLVPAGGTIALGYAIYSIFPWVPRLWNQSLSIGQDFWGDQEDGTINLIIFYADRIWTTIWSLFETLMFTAICMAPDDMSRDDLVSALIAWSGLGVFGTVLKVTFAATGEPTMKKLVYNDFLFDGVLYLLLISIFAFLAFILSILIYWTTARLSCLAEHLQGSSSRSLVWKASHSPLGEVPGRVTDLLRSALALVVRLMRINSWKVFLTSKGHDHNDAEPGLDIEVMSSQEDSHTEDQILHRQTRRRIDLTPHLSLLLTWMLAITKHWPHQRLLRLWTGVFDKSLSEGGEDVGLLEDFED